MKQGASVGRGASSRAFPRIPRAKRTKRNREADSRCAGEAGTLFPRGDSKWPGSLRARRENNLSGYSGQSGWTSHVVHLDDYADKEILVRFQYVTDAAVHLDGMLIKEARLSKSTETSFSEELRWVPSGFVLVEDSLEQKFLVQIIKELKSGRYTVDKIMLDDFNQARYSLRDDENLDSVTVVVSGITGLTQQPAVFNLEVSEIFDK